MAIPVYIESATYAGNQVDTPGDVIKRGVFNTQDLAMLGFTVREDVVVREQMYLLSAQENITRKRTGCGERTNTGRLIAREKWLEVENMQIWDEICAEDFGGTFWELYRKKGGDVNNLDGTLIQDVLNELYSNIWKRDMLTIVQFGDTSINPGVKPATPGPEATSAEKAAYQLYMLKATLASQDGFWKKVFTGVGLKNADAADPDGIVRAVTIDQAAALPEHYTRDVLLPALYNGQSDLMDEVDDSEKRFVLSRSLYANLEASLRNPGVTLEKAYDIFRDGAGEIRFNGILVVKNKLIEQRALTPYAAGDPRTFKRRAYLIVDGGFQVGTDTIQESQTMKTWYSDDTDLNNIRIRYKLGTQYVDGDVLVVAY
ncbi:hypothetical protein HER32_11975 [Hymenobacter sp. BT18]|uniref:hypothetical protein n=1 Tax=Hymenobacter sp. BT18 TaxID=2835648 RepID=UPI00143E3FBE|nr:hypothetical protein [Hymenobacter sp. BT18]QIX61860.1 hypothetical protein HER32_11975 [Hymenobacter sp. BT18]